MLLQERGEMWKLVNAMPWKADGDDDGANISLEAVIPIRFPEKKKEEWKGNNGWVLVASGSLDSLLTPACWEDELRCEIFYVLNGPSRRKFHSFFSQFLKDSHNRVALHVKGIWLDTLQILPNVNVACWQLKNGEWDWWCYYNNLSFFIFFQSPKCGCMFSRINMLPFPIKGFYQEMLF